MRKTLLPLVASLALCGAAAAALVTGSARAQPTTRKPVLLAALVGPDTQSTGDAASPRDMRAAHSMGPDRAARMQQMCRGGYAHEAGRMAYLEAQLNLTASEQPLFQHWKDAKLGIARRHAETCGRMVATHDRAHGSGRHPFSLSDQMAHREDRLKQRLADLDAERPALDSFYNVLTPAQKMELDRSAMMGEMMRHRMFADAAGPHGRMGGRGPMGGQMDGRTDGPMDGPMDRMAPPPPNMPGSPQPLER